MRIERDVIEYVLTNHRVDLKPLMRDEKDKTACVVHEITLKLLNTRGLIAEHQSKMATNGSHYDAGMLASRAVQLAGYEARERLCLDLLTEAMWIFNNEIS